MTSFFMWRSEDLRYVDFGIVPALAKAPVHVAEAVTGCLVIRHSGQWSEAEREPESSIELILYIIMGLGARPAFDRA